MSVITLTQPNVNVPSVNATIVLDSTAADAKWDADTAARVPANEQLATWRRIMLAQAIGHLSLQIGKCAPVLTPAQLAAQQAASARAEAEKAAAVLVDQVP